MEKKMLGRSRFIKFSVATLLSLASTTVVFASVASEYVNFNGEATSVKVQTKQSYLLQQKKGVERILRPDGKPEIGYLKTTGDNSFIITSDKNHKHILKRVNVKSLGNARYALSAKYSDGRDADFIVQHYPKKSVRKFLK